MALRLWHILKIYEILSMIASRTVIYSYTYHTLKCALKITMTRTSLFKTYEVHIYGVYTALLSLYTVLERRIY